jgi:hypothetical protein
MHISCRSDTYKSGHDYAGIVIYQYNGRSDWVTANGTRCKSGYIVIQDTNSNAVKQWNGAEPGKVHEAVYRNAFGEPVNHANVVGESFTLQQGMFQTEENRTFTNPSKVFTTCVKQIVKYWKEAGPSWAKTRTFKVEKLMSDPNYLEKRHKKTDREGRGCHIL